MADEHGLEGIPIKFASGGLPGDDIRLRGLLGRERLSGLFEFDLLLTRPSGPFTPAELDQLLGAPCAVAMGDHPGDVVHGLLERVQRIDAARTVPPRYLARMVPNAWLLTLARTNRVFMDTTVPKMIEALLTQYGFVRGTHFDVLVTRSVTREYVVQYQESDWDFIQRWLEQEGLFYWFSHGNEGEKLIIAETNVDATPIEAPASLSYRERNNLSTGGDPTVWDWDLLQRRVPARVAVFDYNYRTPHLKLAAKAVVDEKNGFGTVFHYGEHFKDADAGKAVAKLRAEQVLSGRRTFSGRTDCGRFRVGHSFKLENHFDAGEDGQYLITSIEHRAGYPVLPDRGDLGDAPQRYFARFEAIPFDVPFRPERVTPWPKIHGVIHAHIDSDGGGEQAQIDDQGRYKVKMPFDISGSKGSKSSRWIRMAQPYAGAGYGSHMPLHKGTEVLVAHLDGDPDRPIIVGAVPNPHTASPSTGANATQSVIQTASGIRIEMEDVQG
jgi:type VI secretion system secreted protein VgrG